MMLTALHRVGILVDVGGYLQTADLLCRPLVLLLFYYFFSEALFIK